MRRWSVLLMTYLYTWVFCVYVYVVRGPRRHSSHAKPDCAVCHKSQHTHTEIWPTWEIRLTDDMIWLKVWDTHVTDHQMIWYAHVSQETWLTWWSYHQVSHISYHHMMIWFAYVSQETWLTWWSYHQVSHISYHHMMIWFAHVSQEPFAPCGC